MSYNRYEGEKDRKNNSVDKSRYYSDSAYKYGVDRAEEDIKREEWVARKADNIPTSTDFNNSTRYTKSTSHEDSPGWFLVAAIANISIGILMLYIFPVIGIFFFVFGIIAIKKMFE